MMNALSRSVTLCALLFAVSNAIGDGKIYLEAANTSELIAKEGQKIVVYGETSGSEKSASGTNFVNFTGAEFCLVTFKTDLAQFKEGEPYLIYDGKRLAVEGTITIYQGKPQIKLTAEEQVVVLVPESVFPPPVKVEAKNTVPEKTKSEEKMPEEKAVPETPAKKPPVDPAEYFKD